MINWINEQWELITQKELSEIISDTIYSGKNKTHKFFMIENERSYKRYAIVL